MDDLIKRSDLKNIKFFRNDDGELEGFVSVKDINAAPTVPAIPINVIEGMREEIQHIDDLEVVNGGLYIREFDAVNIIDRYIKEYTE